MATTAARVLVSSAVFLMFVIISLIFRGSSGQAPSLTQHTAGANLPAEVDKVFRRACKDCHSNETEWPWYANLPPLSLAIRADVNRGRSLFNMSDWNTYSNGRRRGFLSAIQVDLARKNMPPRAYRWMHRTSNLSQHDEELLRTWATQEGLRLRAAPPPAPGGALQLVTPVPQYEGLAPRV